MTVRLDTALVGRGLARSRGHAAELVRGGVVTVDGAPAGKASQPVDDDAVLEVEAGPTRVGRAAHKLETAVRLFAEPTSYDAPLVIAGRRCLDVGASTGGFTQILLEQGASHVTALDVGHGQLAAELARDPRVRDLPGTNIRDVTPADLGTYDVVVADLSFISLRVVVPHLAPLIAPGGQAVVLVKPQFEVGRERLGKHGVVRDARDQARAVAAVAEAVRAARLHPRAVEPSGVPGGGGNREYLMWITTDPRHALVDDEAAAADAVRRFGRQR